MSIGQRRFYINECIVRMCLFAFHSLNWKRVAVCSWHLLELFVVKRISKLFIHMTGLGSQTSYNMFFLYDFLQSLFIFFERILR